MTSNRTLRSGASSSNPIIIEDPDPDPDLDTTIPACVSLSQGIRPRAIRQLQEGSTLPSIGKTSLSLLREKQDRLKATKSAIEDAVPPDPRLRQALASTLIFAHYEAGTAVCVDSSGWILTCSHCFGESKEEFQKNKHKWALFYTGQAVLMRCEVWDPKRDLALARVVAIESETIDSDASPVFAAVRLSPNQPPGRAKIICLGQPGRDDLQSTSARKTTYDLIEVSSGVLRGVVEGADPQDNSDIGTQKHDAWTYWGHSGAPLVMRSDGTLVGLHSSWDDQTAMRHGIPWVAIRDFLRENNL